MKKLLFTFLFCFLTIVCFNQIVITKYDGPSNITKLGFGVSVNSNSTLHRNWINLNDTLCPVQLISTGINTSYITNNGYSYKAVGQISTKENVVAIQIHHVLYDVFSNHISTLNQTIIADINGIKQLENSSWYANENDVSEYLTCVSYIAYVRTAEGKIWSYSPSQIENELSKIQINYDNSFAPKENEN